MNETREQRIRAFSNCFRGPSGEIVLEELEKAYIRHADDSVIAQQIDIPHPFVAYFQLGQQSVVRGIEAAMAAAESPDEVVRRAPPPDYPEEAAE